MYYTLNKHPLEMTLADRWTESLVRCCGGDGGGGEGGGGGAQSGPGAELTGGTEFGGDYGGYGGYSGDYGGGVGLAAELDPSTPGSVGWGATDRASVDISPGFSGGMGLAKVDRDLQIEALEQQQGKNVAGVVSGFLSGGVLGWGKGLYGLGKTATELSNLGVSYDSGPEPEKGEGVPRFADSDTPDGTNPAFWDAISGKDTGEDKSGKKKTDADKLTSQVGDVEAYLREQGGLLNDLLNTGLTPEEVASFEAQYQAELDALTLEYDRLTERQGAARLSELVGRGVLDTTTGERIMAEDQEEWTRMFTGAQSQLETTKLGAMEDFESAKKGMNLAKYQLQSDMTQKQIDLSLAASMSQQNYLMGKGGIKANEALNQALIQQQQSKLDYDKRSQLWGTVSGVGVDLLKSGISGLF